MLVLTIIVRQSVTVLPRILQILSRRGFVVEQLHTIQLDSNRAELELSVSGHDRWHTALPKLLSRIVEVETVQVVQASQAEQSNG